MEQEEGLTGVGLKTACLTGACGDRVQYALHYPQAQVPAHRTEGFDRFWRRQMTGLEQRCRRWGQHGLTVVAADWQEMRNDGRYLSAFADISFRVGYGDWRLERISATFCIGGSRPLPVQTFFQGKWQPVLRQALREQLAERRGEEGYFHGGMGDPLRCLTPYSYYLADDGLAVWFPQEAIAARCEGLPTFLLPFARLQPVLRISE